MVRMSHARPAYQKVGPSLDLNLELRPLWIPAEVFTVHYARDAGYGEAVTVTVTKRSVGRDDVVIDTKTGLTAASWTFNFFALPIILLHGDSLVITTSVSQPQAGEWQSARIDWVEVPAGVAR